MAGFVKRGGLGKIWDFVEPVSAIVEVISIETSQQQVYMIELHHDRVIYEPFWNFWNFLIDLHQQYRT